MVQSTEIRREAAPAADQKLDLATQRFPHRRENQPIGDPVACAEPESGVFGVGVRAGDVGRPLEDPLSRARFGGLLPDRRVDFLVHPGDARPDGRGDEAEILPERVGTLGVCHRRTAREHQEMAREAFENVRQRQKRDRPGGLTDCRDRLILADPKARPALVDVRLEVPVGQFDAFWLSRCPGCVDQARQIVRFALLKPPPVGVRVDPRTAIVHLTQGVDGNVEFIAGLRGDGVHDDDERQVEIALDRGDALEEIRVPDDDGVRASISEQVRGLPRRGVGVHGRDDRTRRQQGQIRLGPLHTGVREDADAITRPDAEVTKPGRQRPDDSCHFVVTDHPKCAVGSGLDCPGDERSFVHPALVRLSVGVGVARRCLGQRLRDRRLTPDRIVPVELRVTPIHTTFYRGPRS